MDPDGNKEKESTEVWTAKETLVMTGVEMRFALSGMTYTKGYADVEFSNGTRTYHKRYEVMSTYSEGLFFSFGVTVTSTEYTKTFEAGVSEEEVYSSYEGIFATQGISISTPFKGVSFVMGDTFAIDEETKDIAENGWQGKTHGASGGGGTSLDVKVKGLSINFGTQFTAYRDPDIPNNELSDHPKCFFYTFQTVVEGATNE